MIDLFVKKLRRRDVVSEDEVEQLRDMVVRTRTVGAGELLIGAGEESSHSLLLLDGFTIRHKDLSEGGRQILELNLAGDFVDLHAFLLKPIDHSVSALTKAKVALVSHEKLTRITEECPHLTRLLWFQTALDAAIHREWVTTLGQRAALGRLVHLFCELHVRLEAIGLADEHGFDLPLTQIDLADIAGLTPVHVNRTLKVMRDEGLMTYNRGRVEIRDRTEMCRRADFDDSYLYMRKRRA